MFELTKALQSFKEDGDIINNVFYYQASYHLGTGYWTGQLRAEPALQAFVMASSNVSCE